MQPDRGIYHGNSMSNVFVDGDVLLFSDVPFDKLECGDIVAVFERSPYYVHRIIEKDENTAVTMGDNNRRPDELKLNRNSKFKFVKTYIPVKSPGRILSTEAGPRGMKQFRRQQRVILTRGIIRKALTPVLWLKYCRIPARHETRFRDGTVQLSCCGVAVAARSPEGKTRYLHWSSRLFFRVPQSAAYPAGCAEKTTGDTKTTGHDPEMK